STVSWAPRRASRRARPRTSSSTRPRSRSGACAPTARPPPDRASAMSEQDLLYERRGAAAIITFNRPQARNAMTFAMYETLHQHGEDVEADADFRVLVRRGAGGKSFVSGTDIRQFLDFDSGRTGVEYEAEIDRYVGRLDRLRKPAIAMIDGYAVGAGLAIAS